jgi:hypothetical protein
MAGGWITSGTDRSFRGAGHEAAGRKAVGSIAAGIGRGQNDPMAQVETLSIALTVAMAAELRAAVATGDCGSVSEVIRDALREWRLRARYGAHRADCSYRPVRSPISKTSPPASPETIRAVPLQPSTRCRHRAWPSRGRRYPTRRARTLPQGCGWRCTGIRCRFACSPRMSSGSSASCTALATFRACSEAPGPLQPATGSTVAP